MDIFVGSETEHLSSVIVHTPGTEVSLVNPELKDELLFDDIIFEEDARREHLDMLNIFKAAMPENGQIYEITDLFLESFQQEQARAYFIKQLIKELPEENLQAIENELRELNPDELLQFVIEGATPAISGFSMLPTPNLLFTRDLSAIIGNNIL
ncbi:MAG TPA: arginine deiminase family protein, partial [Fodinibius sp.]|nr:arginine deiminase family protein [Fodinibius sp.]